MPLTEQIKRAVHETNCFTNQAESKNREIHIGFGINAAYARPMGVAIASIVVNNPDLSLVFHVFESSIEEEDIQRLKILVDTYKRISIHLYHVDEQVISHLPTLKYLPLATYFRMMIPIVLRDVASVLYLDSDIVCLNNISELTHINLTDYVCAAVLDIDSTRNEKVAELGLKSGQYFNAGVTFMNIKQWNDQSISEKAFELLTTRDFSLLDQDVLNILLENQVCYLPEKWNCAHGNPEIQKDIVFLHCTAHPKPWKAACKDEVQKYYLQCEKSSPWAEQPLVPPTSYREARLYANLLLKRGDTGEALSWYVKYLGMKFQAKF